MCIVSFWFLVYIIILIIKLTSLFFIFRYFFFINLPTIQNIQTLKISHFLAYFSSLYYKVIQIHWKYILSEIKPIYERINKINRMQYIKTVLCNTYYRIYASHDFYALSILKPLPPPKGFLHITPIGVFRQEKIIFFLQ